MPRTNWPLPPLHFQRRQRLCASVPSVPDQPRLTRANELELALLEVVSPSPSHSDATRADQRLADVAARVRTHGADADVRVVEAADPATVIIEAVRQELVDFIAMTTRGASGLERLVLGSVATGVVRKSEVCVFLVRPG